MWEHGRARGVLQGSKFGKGRKKCQGWGVFERSLFICKVFSPRWGRRLGWRRGKEARASSGLYLLQLRQITKLLPWASHSERPTSPMTEPVIPCKETGNWFLWEERGRGRRGVLAESRLLSGGTGEPGFLVSSRSCFLPHLWNDNQVHEGYHRKTAASSDRRGGCLSRTHQHQQCLGWWGADDFCRPVGVRWGVCVWGFFWVKLVSNEPRRCCKHFGFSDRPISQKECFAVVNLDCSLFPWCVLCYSNHIHF